MHQVGENHLVHPLRISSENGDPSEGTQNRKEKTMFGRRSHRNAVEKKKIVGGAALGAVSAGALAAGAFALGAFAVGALAIGRMAVGSARIKRMEIDELIVGKLTIREK
jgi:hypothetical protein